jgi:hypothetical protein
MVSSEWILNNLREYILEHDVNLRHGWLQLKVEGVVMATKEEFREQLMHEIEVILSKPYFAAVNELDTSKITESEFWSRTARYTDAFQILRNIRSEYHLPNSSLLNPNHS